MMKVPYFKVEEERTLGVGGSSAGGRLVPFEPSHIKE